MNIDVANKVVVITGASRGIGSELAKAFAVEKANVVMNYHNSKMEAEFIFDEVTRYSSQSLFIRADVKNPLDVSVMYHEVVRRFGHVDVLINNAGICNDDYIQMMSIEQWQNVIDVNLTGTFLCCREFLRIMIKQKKGKIINIASLKGQEGSSGQVNYSASKGGIIALTKSLAKELGDYNISVNAICPGFIVTDLNRNNNHKLNVAKSKSVLPIRSSMDDLINVCLFLSSSLTEGISGQVFNIDSRIL